MINSRTVVQILEDILITFHYLTPMRPVGL
jgi:hypothetical protein